MRWKTEVWLIFAVIAISYEQVIAHDLNLQNLSDTPNVVDNNNQVPTNNVESLIAKDSNVNDENVVSDNEDNSHRNKSVELPAPMNLVALSKVSSKQSTTDKVQTENGFVQGYNWGESTDILSFLDVPYGSIQTLFEEPSPPASWDTLDNNIKHSKRCPQLQTNTETSVLEVTGELDCLTLSIFAPRGAEKASVLFHIHDGNFISGSGDPSIYGPDYIVSKGIILVLPNYRIGPLGFLCLQNETAPGNAALKDLTQALQWIHRNIESFGGNPDNIVVSGEGTSGALAGYLALSPKSRDYISKVIADSGSVISNWAIDRHPIETAAALAQKIRDAHSTETFNDDLFHEIDMEILLLVTHGEHFRPCIDNSTDPFLTVSPWNILQEQKINISFMIGSASHAGLHEALAHDENSISELNKNFETFLPDDLMFEEGETEKVAEKVKTQYFGEKNISIANVVELSECYTDALYLGPVIRMARVLVEAGATVYFYEFAFKGDFNRELISFGEKASAVDGSARGDIVGYLFTQDEHQLEVDSDEDRIVKLMTDLWVSFIENGKPTSDQVEWNELTSTKEYKEEEWLWIGSKTVSMKGIHVDRLELWSEIYEAHFVERNLARSLYSQYPVFVIAAIYLLGVFPRSLQCSR